MYPVNRRTTLYMAYDRTIEQTIVISKKHHSMLKDLSKKEMRTLRTTTELIIENAHAKAKISV